MSGLIIPGQGGAAFDLAFFRREFAEKGPACDVDADQVPVVELVLTNGDSPDVASIEELRRDLLVAKVFADPPDCSTIYTAFVRYDAIYQVNIKTYPSSARRLGFGGAPPRVEA